MSSTTSLKKVFDLTQIGEDRWSGSADGVNLPQVYGGQLVGQSLVAATHSLEEGRLPHSMHTTFLRPGRSDQPVEYRVERVRDGGLFSSRTVDAVQNDTLICRTLVSCSVDEYDGVGHSRRRPQIAPPRFARTIQQIAEEDGGLGAYWDDLSSIEVRIAPVNTTEITPRSAAPERHVWIRVTEDLGDDRAMHLAAVAYASDLMLIGAAVTPHGYTIGHERTLARNWRAVSLDHSLWFHRHLRADDWMLFELSTPTAAKGRVVVEASLFGDHGSASPEQAVHVVQEAFVRPAAS